MFVPEQVYENISVHFYPMSIVALVSGNECDWAEVGNGHYNGPNATSTVTPGSSFVRFPWAEESGSESTVETPA